MARAIGWFLRWNRITDSPESDAELLRRFAFDKEPGTLETLISRHGGLVLGTCERILRDAQLAEDAFQAVFFVLAKRAGSIHGLLPAWLHQVAQRICWRLLRKHRAMVLNRPTVSTTSPADDYAQQELLAVLDEEITRLPAKHRSVIQLCYLQDRTAEVAGQLLGIPRGTVLSRLDSARRKLQAAFTKRGITSMAILTIPTLAVSVSPALAATSAGVARGLIIPSTSAVVSMALTELTIMKLRTWIICGMVTAGMLGFGGTVFVLQKASAGDEAKKTEKSEKPKEITDEKKKELEGQRSSLLKQKRKVEDLHFETKLRQEVEQLSIQKDGLSERTLRAAIEKEELKMLDEEVRITAAHAAFERTKKILDIKIEAKLDSDADMRRFMTAMFSLQRMSKTKEWPKEFDANDVTNYLSQMKEPSLVAESQNFIMNHGREASLAILAKLKPLLEKEYLRQQEAEIKLSEGRLNDAKAQLATTKTRRDELLERLARVTRNNADVLADDAEIYRETRKALLKKIQQVELELAGVKLP